MTLAAFDVTNFRGIERANLQFDPRCTLIVGANAAGKTSILEAVHLLSCGRSFRTNRVDDLIRTGCDQLTISGAIEGTHFSRLGVQVSRLVRTVRFEGQKVQSFERLAEVLPVLAIDPSAHKILEEGPSRRRRYLDWGTFHVEHGFLTQWRRYQRAVSHRNAALKSNQSMGLVRSWDSEMIESGAAVTACRSRYVAEILPTVESISSELLGVPAKLAYVQGWRADVGLEKALADSWSRDTRFKATTVGPHRADFEIRMNGEPVKDRISRGQQKLLACALLLSQIEHLSRTGREPPCLLLDDPAAELDVDNFKKLLALVAKIPSQLVVTSLQAEPVNVLAAGKVFHVKQGTVDRML